jgi:hypothetical protein
VIAHVARARAQIRGLYAPGTTATNSGVLPGAGLTYQALFRPYSFDEAKTADGHRLPSGKPSVLAGRSGFAASYFSPLTLGWKPSRADLQGVTASCGRSGGSTWGARTIPAAAIGEKAA